jgi:hypothetical protein
VLFRRSMGVRSLSLLPRGLPVFEGRGDVYSGGGFEESWTPSPTCGLLLVDVVAAAVLDSPGSSLEGMCVRCAKEISVGERTGPGLVGGWCLKFPLLVRPCRGSG